MSPEEYRRFLERGLALAERRTRNSFHCQSSDCRGWCIYEDSVNEFRCPICQALNCLLCKVSGGGGPAHPPNSVPCTGEGAERCPSAPTHPSPGLVPCRAWGGGSVPCTGEGG